MKVALCCIGRLENRYIKEYVEYYLGIGVDKIFIYDNNRDGEEHFEDVIGDYVESGFVEIIDYRDKTVCQLEAYQDCYDKHNKEYDWMCFFDIDEFLAFQKVNTIKEWLSLPIYDEYQMIHVNFLTYDDNNLVRYEDKPVIERFTKPVIPLNFTKRNNIIENNHIKSVIRGGLDVKWIDTPHTPSNDIRCCNSSGKKCNSSCPFVPYNYTNAFIKHFPTKTIEEYRDIKVKRGYPDNNKDFFKKNDWVYEFFLYNKKTTEKLRFLGIEEETDADIFICTHKDFENPLSNPIYKVFNANVINGDVSNNGLKGSFYSEIMSYKYIYENIKLKKYVGFCSYRKYFKFLDNVPNLDEIFETCDVIVAKPLIYESSIKEQYERCHNIEDLYIVGGILADKYPEYQITWHNFINNNILLPYNMFIMRTEDFGKYIEFMFDVLDEYVKIVGTDIEKRITNNKDKYIKDFYPNDSVEYQYRIGGYLAERLTNIFLLRNFKEAIYYPVIITEDKYNLENNEEKLSRK